MTYESTVANVLRSRIRSCDSTICIGLPGDSQTFNDVRFTSDFISAREYNLFSKYACALRLSSAVKDFETLRSNHGLTVVWNACLADVASAFADSQLVVLLTHNTSNNQLELAGQLYSFDEVAAVIPADWKGVLAGNACGISKFTTTVRQRLGEGPRLIIAKKDLELDRWLVLYALFFEMLAETSLDFGTFFQIFSEELERRLN